MTRRVKAPYYAPMGIRPSLVRKQPRGKFLLLLGAILIVGLASALADETQPQKKKPPAQRKVHLVVLPLAFYAPETELAGGLGGLLTYRLGSQAETARPSSMFFYAIYTLLGQFQAQAEPILYFQGEDQLLDVKMTFELYPNKFWGIGSETPTTAETNYTPRRLALEASFQKKMPFLQNLYAGLQYQFETVSIVKTQSNPPLVLNSFAGGTGGTVSGLGLILNWDTRNNIFTPSRGSQLQFSVVVNAKMLGGNFDFTAVKADLRAYLPGFMRGQAAAFQFLYESATGTLPFYRYPMIGGESLLRGYYKGRYRDKYLIALQAEYRLPVWGPLGLVGFGGLGNVGPTLDRIDFKKPKYSAGLGVRYKLSLREGANVRADLAFGNNSWGLYFTAGEAF